MSPERAGETDDGSGLTINKDRVGNIVVTVVDRGDDETESASIVFSPISSPHTFKALASLMEAIQKDNIETPTRPTQMAKEASLGAPVSTSE